MAFLPWLSIRLLRSPGSHTEERIVRDAVEMVVERIDPRLHLVKGYQKKLWRPVETSLAYASNMVERFPPPLEVSSKSWSTDPVVHAIFSSRESLKRTVSRSEAVGAFFDTPEGSRLDEVFAVLSMQMRETRRFGTQLQGETVQREVLQTSVGFVDHVVDVPNAAEPRLRAALKRVTFEKIVLYALGHIASMKALKAGLEKERAMLQMRYRLLQGVSADGKTVFGIGTSGGEELQAIQAKLEENNRHLRETFDRFKTLEHYLDCVKTILEHPQKYLTLTATSIRLNRMNVVVDECDPSGNDIPLLEANGVNKLQRIVLLVRYPRKDLLPKEDLLKMAKRYLG